MDTPNKTTVPLAQRLRTLIKRAVGFQIKKAPLTIQLKLHPVKKIKVKALPVTHATFNKCNFKLSKKQFYGKDWLVITLTDNKDNELREVASFPMSSFDYGQTVTIANINAVFWVEL